MSTNEDDAALNAWLAPLGCYHDALREHGYDDLLTLQALEDDELRQMLDTCGVVKEGHRVLFRRKIADLAAKRLTASVPAPAPAPAPAPTPAPVAAPAASLAAPAPAPAPATTTATATATATTNPLLDQPQPPALLPPQTYAPAATPPAYGGLPPVTAPPPKPIPVDEEQFRALGERSRQIADQCAQQLVSRAPLYAMQTAFTPAGLHHVQPVPAQEIAPTLTPSRLSRRHEVPALDAALPPPPPPPAVRHASPHVSPSRDGVTVDDLRTKRDAVAKYLLALDEQLYATAAHAECEAAAAAAVSASTAPAASLAAAGTAAPTGVRPLANST